MQSYKVEPGSSKSVGKYSWRGRQRSASAGPPRSFAPEGVTGPGRASGTGGVAYELQLIRQVVNRVSRSSESDSSIQDLRFFARGFAAPPASSLLPSGCSRRTSSIVVLHGSCSRPRIKFALIQSCFVPMSSRRPSNTKALFRRRLDRSQAAWVSPAGHSPAGRVPQSSTSAHAST